MSNFLSLDLDRLQQENQQLSEQVKRLVRAERRMIEAQNLFDQQIAMYRHLNELGKQFGKTFSISDILRHTTQFIIYELNFERCLILHSCDDEPFQVAMFDGYHDETSIDQLSFTLEEPVFSPFLVGAEFLICPATSEDPSLRQLGDRLEMDEFVVFPIGNENAIEFLIAIGNTTSRAKYHCRIQNDDIALIGLVNLVSQASAALNQAKLYAAVRDRATTLEQTLEELQRTQTHLVQSEKMSSLGQLVAGVAHEINNPVNFIYGNINHADEYVQELLNLVRLYQAHQSEPAPEIQEAEEEMDFEFLVEDLPKLLSSMRMGADRIKQIVSSLRIFSRMDEAECKQVNLHDGIDSTLLILEHRLKAKPSRPAIAILKDYGDLPLVECYAGQLNQVFMNILSNAIDALEEYYEQNSALQPKIRIRTDLMQDSWVVVAIADNGAGIPPAVQARLFDPFFTTKPVGKGTGMGLSISYQIVTERHGGTLKCLSAVGEGTEFVIAIPVHQLR